MADKPILFSGPMVRALIAGTKTQTRRTLNPQPVQNSAGLWTWERRGVSVQGEGLELALAQRIAIGDRLWVKETSRITSWGGDGEVWLTYAADDAKSGMLLPRDEDFLERLCARVEKAGAETDATGMYINIPPGALVRPSIFMPRWASRITLTVTDVRVERLQDISDSDVTAEGCRRITDHGMDGWEYHGEHWMTFADGSNACCFKRAQDSYRQLWEMINGRRSWDANPWVAAYTFTVEMGNIDTLARAA
jgi:hypothetical protein